jgi:hypothetical protein
MVLAEKQCVSEADPHHAVAVAVGFTRRADGLALAALTSLVMGALLAAGTAVVVVRPCVLQVLTASCRQHCKVLLSGHN